MNEQISGQAPAGNKKLVATVIILMVAVAVVAAYFIYQSIMRPADPMTYLPEDCAIAFTIDITPSQDKQDAVDFINGVLKEFDVESPEKDLFESIDKALDISVEEDVVKHLNGTLAFGVLPEFKQMIIPSVTLCLGSSSASGADAVAKVIRDEITESGLRFVEEDYEHGKYHKALWGMASLCVGSCDSVVVVALNTSAYEKTAATIYGGPNLASNADFKKVRLKDDSTIMEFYVSGEKYFELLEPMLKMQLMASPDPSAMQMIEKMEEQMKGLFAASAVKASGEGIKLEGLSTVGGYDYSDLKNVEIDKLAAKVPENAIIAMAIPGFQKYWQIQQESMSYMMPEAQMKEMQDEIKAELGVDLFTDVLDKITGMNGYFSVVPDNENPDEPILPVIALNCEFVDADSAQKAVGALVKAMKEDGETTAQTANMNGMELDVFVSKKEDLSIISGTNAKTGFVVIGAKNWKESAKSASAFIAGDAPKLTGSDRFEMVKGFLPDASVMLVYSDIAPLKGLAITEMVRDIGRGMKGIDEDMLDVPGPDDKAKDVTEAVEDMDDKEIADMLEKLDMLITKIGPMAGTSNIDGELVRSELVIPFLEKSE